MTNYITVRNNCRAVKIHCALLWATFQQDFRNDIPPRGGYVEYELHDAGWHDLAIIVGTTANRFDARNNGRSLVLGQVLDQVLTLEKDLFLLQKPDLSAITNVKVVDGVRLRPNAVMIPAIHTPDGNDIVVTGGDIQGRLEDDGSYVITRIDPLRAHWSNRCSPQSQKDYPA
jgi:hypothetical protein